MAASAEIISKPIAGAISLRWIIGARDDLVWFIGSVFSSYALLILYVSGILPLIPMVALWAILIDAPHVFGTFSRTYFDRTERKNRARLLWGSLAFFAVGPVMVLAGAGFVFLFVAALWAYYHLVKQHYGFMVLYKKKNGDLARVDNVLDRSLLLFAFNYPFVEFIARDPDAMARVPALLRGGVSGFSKLLLAGTILIFVVWLGRQVQRWLTDIGAAVLVNGARVMSRGNSGLRVAGLDDVFEGTPDPAIGSDTRSRTPTIVLSHNPDGLLYLHPELRVDLVVAGHTHGGQIVVPGYGAPLTMAEVCSRRSASGWISHPRAPLYVTRGLGEQLPLPFRVNCRRELVVVRLTSRPTFAASTA